MTIQHSQTDFKILNTALYLQHWPTAELATLLGPYWAFNLTLTLSWFGYIDIISFAHRLLLAAMAVCIGRVESCVAATLTSAPAQRSAFTQSGLSPSQAKCKGVFPASLGRFSRADPFVVTSYNKDRKTSYILFPSLSSFILLLLVCSINCIRRVSLFSL